MFSDQASAAPDMDSLGALLEKRLYAWGSLIMGPPTRHGPMECINALRALHSGEHIEHAFGFEQAARPATF